MPFGQIEALPHQGVQIAYERIEGTEPTFVWLGGFKSDMAGTKAQTLEIALTVFGNLARRRFKNKGVRSFVTFAAPPGLAVRPRRERGERRRGEDRQRGVVALGLRVLQRRRAEEGAADVHATVERGLVAALGIDVVEPPLVRGAEPHLAEARRLSARGTPLPSAILTPTSVLLCGRRATAIKAPRGHKNSLDC